MVRPRLIEGVLLLFEEAGDDMSIRVYPAERSEYSRELRIASGGSAYLSSSYGTSDSGSWSFLQSVSPVTRKPMWMNDGWPRVESTSTLPTSNLMP